MKNLLITLSFCLIFPIHGFGQLSQSKRDSLARIEVELRSLSDSMVNGSTEQVRILAEATFNPMFFDLCLDPDVFEYGFDSLKHVSVMASPDKQLKVFSWMFTDRAKEQYRYYGVVLARKKNSRAIKRTGLVDVNYPHGSADFKKLEPNEWFGAVYYDILQKNYKGKTNYVLLGWRANDKLSTKKVIDVITLNEWGDPVFGAPIFVDDRGKIRYRHEFEYSSQAVMSLRFASKGKRIIFDHLSAPASGLREQYHTYGPDFTYDAYIFKSGKWLYKMNLEMKNPPR